MRAGGLVIVTCGLLVDLIGLWGFGLWCWIVVVFYLLFGFGS